MENERRKRTRVPFHIKAFVSIQGADVEVDAVNISLTGLSCTPNPIFKDGEPCEVNIILTPEITISIKSYILRTFRGETAVVFVSMSEESFFHLKRLLQFHADNADQIDDDLNDTAFKA